MLREVLENLNRAIIKPTGIRILRRSRRRPHELIALSKGRIRELGKLIDDEFSVSADGEITAAGGELDALGVHFAVAEVFYLGLELFAVFEVCGRQELEVGGLVLVGADPDDFAVGESGEWGFFAELDDDGGILETEADEVAFWEAVDAPNGVKPIVEESFVLKGV